MVIIAILLILALTLSSHDSHCIQNLEIRTMIKRPVVTNHAFFAVIIVVKTNGLIVLSKYPTKYLALTFILTNFEITIFSTLTSQFFIGFFAA